MLVSARQNGDETVLSVSSARLDASVADSFKSEAVAVIDAGTRRLTIDLSSVEFMDSSGLGALVGTMKHLGANGSFSLSNPNSPVMKVLRLTRMNKVFTIHNPPSI